MEHVVSTTSLVFPTTCRNYYDPYRQKSMAPSTKTYTIRNEPLRKPRKTDSLDLIRNNPPDFHTDTQVPPRSHPTQRPTSTSAPAIKIVTERRSAPTSGSETTNIKDSKPTSRTTADEPTVKPLKPILKPAPRQTHRSVTKPEPAVLTDSQSDQKQYNHQRESLPLGDDPSLRYLPNDSPSPKISRSNSKTYKPARRIFRSRTTDTRQDERSNKVTPNPQIKTFFSFTCLKPRKKSSEKPAPSFRVLNSRVSEYEVVDAAPFTKPPRSKAPRVTTESVPIARYKFLYPKVPENIPGTAGRNSISPTPPQKPKQPNPPPPPPHRVVKKLSSHLSRHPAVRTLMYQYPTVEMYEKRTGFDTYFDSPFVEYSHSYWTSLHRPPSPFKRTKPLKVKFEAPVSPMSHPRNAPLQTYGPKRDLGAEVRLADEYSYPYSPDDYEKRFHFGFARDSILEGDRREREVRSQGQTQVSPPSGKSCPRIAFPNESMKC